MTSSVTVDLEARPSRLRSIGKYQNVRKIGEGGQGTVYAAYDPILDRAVALKTIGTSHVAARARFLREARALARVTHPNVVQVYEVDTIDEVDVIVMELLDGETLRNWLATPRPRRAIVDAFLELGRGLAAVHAVGLVHRDVKPDNVIRTEDGRFVLVDFGLARSTEDGSETTTAAPSAAHATTVGQVLGTIAYMAPEQLVGEPAGPPADQFAFCVSLWEALTGALPPETTRDDRRRALATSSESAIQPPVTRRGLPWGMQRVLRKGLAVAAPERWSSMTALLARLARARWIRTRGPWLVAVALGVAIAALALRSPNEAVVDPACDALVAEAASTSRALDALGAATPIRTTARSELGQLHAALAASVGRACEATRQDPHHAARTTCLTAATDELAVAVALVHRLAPTDPRALNPLDNLPAPEVCDRETPATRVPIPRATLLRVRGVDVGVGNYTAEDLAQPCTRAIAYPDETNGARAAEERYAAALQCGDEVRIASAAVEVPYTLYLHAIQTPAYYTARARAEAALRRAPIAGLTLPVEIFAARDAWDEARFGEACAKARGALRAMSRGSWSYVKLVVEAVGKFCATSRADADAAIADLQPALDPASRLAIAEQTWDPDRAALRRLGYLAGRAGTPGLVDTVASLLAAAPPPPDGHPLAVQVLDPGGRPLAGIEVIAAAPVALLQGGRAMQVTASRVAITDREGRATIDGVVPGWVVHAHREGELSSPRVIGEDRELAVTLAANATLRGHVRGDVTGTLTTVAALQLPAGAAAPLARLPRGEWQIVERVEPDRSWSLVLPPGEYWISARFGTQRGALIAWRTGDPLTFDVDLPDGLARTVRVRNDASDVTEFAILTFAKPPLDPPATTVGALLTAASARRIATRLTETNLDRAGRSGHYDHAYTVRIPTGSFVCVAAQLATDDEAARNARPVRCQTVDDTPVVAFDAPPLR